LESLLFFNFETHISAGRVTDVGKSPP
jgi:hypothetical protein